LIIVLILLLLFVSIASHLYYLFRFIRTHLEKYFRRFLNTAVFNLFLGGISIIIAIFKPEGNKESPGTHGALVPVGYTPGHHPDAPDIHCCPGLQPGSAAGQLSL